MLKGESLRAVWEGTGAWAVQYDGATDEAFVATVGTVPSTPTRLCSACCSPRPRPRVRAELQRSAPTTTTRSAVSIPHRQQHLYALLVVDDHRLHGAARQPTATEAGSEGLVVPL